MKIDVSATYFEASSFFSIMVCGVPPIKVTVWSRRSLVFDSDESDRTEQ